MISRRGVLVGLAAMFAAPAIVRVSSLMPIKPAPRWLTLADWAQRDADEGHIKELVELLNQSNDLMVDADYTYDRLGTPLIFARRSFSNSSWRSLTRGVEPI